MKNLIIASILLFSYSKISFGFGVDLHAHLFMEKGVKLIYSGGFFLPYIKARHWKNSKKSQVNEKLLKSTDLDIVVASLYAVPILSGTTRFKSILIQIDMAEKFIARNPNWIIAHSSDEAKNAIANGKKVLVLSIEGADKYVNTLSQIKTLYARGVRIITMLHLTRDNIGAPAFLHRMEAIFSTPGAYWACYNRDRNYVKINCSGLTRHGKDVADMLIDAGIWIDLAHASDKSLETLISKHYERNLPLLFTHASLRSKVKIERGVSAQTLSHYKKLGGIFGLVPSKKLLGFTKSCQGTADAFKEHYDELANYMDKDQITVGSDTNGLINHLKPRFKRARCNPSRTYTSFDKNGGWWNFSHTTALWEEIHRMDSTVPMPSKITARFLREWKRVEMAAGKY